MRGSDQPSMTTALASSSTKAAAAATEAARQTRMLDLMTQGSKPNWARELKSLKVAGRHRPPLSSLSHLSLPPPSAPQISPRPRRLPLILPPPLLPLPRPVLHSHQTSFKNTRDFLLSGYRRRWWWRWRRWWKGGCGWACVCLTSFSWPGINCGEGGGGMVEGVFVGAF